MDRSSKVILVTVLMVLVALFTGCISTQTQPDPSYTNNEEHRIGDRIAILQSRIDDVKMKGLPASEWQFKLDGIRGDYSRMMERGRHPT